MANKTYTYPDSPLSKICTKCGEAKGLSEFRKSPRYKAGLFSRCKPCDREDQKKYTNRETRNAYARKYRATKPELHRGWALKKKHGLSLTEYNALLVMQNNVCGICGKPPEGKPLAVDHCHTTGKTRGLLCSRCNCGLGQFLDSISALTSAIDYLNRTNQPT